MGFYWNEKPAFFLKERVSYYLKNIFENHIRSGTSIPSIVMAFFMV
jgi:hypothetical protein